MIVWQYDRSAGLHLNDGPDTRHWYLALSSARSTALKLVAAVLPEPAVAAKLAKAKLEPDLVIKPESQISLVMALSATPPGKSNFAQDVTKVTTDGLARHQITLADGQNVAMNVTMSNIKSGKNMELQIQQFKDGKVNQQKVSIPENAVACSIQVIRNKKAVWERKYTFANQPSLVFGIPDGTTAEQHLNGLMWRGAEEFFLKFIPPAYVFSDAAVNDLGTSVLTAESATAER